MNVIQYNDLNFPLVDCYVAFLLYWQLMEPKCKWEGSCNCGMYARSSIQLYCPLISVTLTNFNCKNHTGKGMVSSVKMLFLHYLSHSSSRTKAMINKCQWQDTCCLRASGACLLCNYFVLVTLSYCLVVVLTKLNLTQHNYTKLY
jgi:hypothetical protein